MYANALLRRSRLDATDDGRHCGSPLAAPDRRPGRTPGCGWMLGLRSRSSRRVPPTTPVLADEEGTPPPVHHGFSCEGCGGPIVGVRHRCLYRTEASGRSRNFCDGCVGGPLGARFAASHGPFEQLSEVPDPESLFDEHGYTPNLGGERFHLLLQEGEQLMSAVLSYLGAKDLARLSCTAQLFRACSPSIRGGLSVVDAAAMDTICRRVAPAPACPQPDCGCAARMLHEMLPAPGADATTHHERASLLHARQDSRHLVPDLWA